MTPAYDLLCTSLHFPNEARTVLDLFDDFETESFRQNAFYRSPDFLKLADRYGISPERAERVLQRLKGGEADAVALINRSFLSADAKQDVRRRLEDRLRAITDSPSL